MSKPSAQDIAAALVGQQQQPQVPQSPFLPDQQLENQVAPNTYPVNPMVLALAQKFGLMNFIRNAQNNKQAIIQGIPE